MKTLNTLLKISFAAIITLVTMTSVYAAPRTNPFTVGATIDPGAEFVQPCGPTDANCFVAVLGIEDEGTALTANAVKLNFVGAGVSATNASGTITITIPGGTSTQNIAFSTTTGTLISGTTTFSGPLVATSATSTLSTIVTNFISGVTGIFTNLFASIINAGNIFTGNITATGTAQFATTSVTELTASSTNTGLLTVTGTSTLATTTATAFSANSLTLPTFTQGSVVFAGTGGLLSQNNSNFFWDNTSSRLGIGTTTPQARLEISGPTSGLGLLKLTGTGDVSSGGTSFMRLNDVNGSAGYLGFGGVNNRLDIYNYKNGPLTLSTNNSEAMRILGNGNVGIGTTTPGNVLHVASSTGAISGLRLGITSASATTTANGKMLTVNASGDVVLVDAASGGAGSSALSGLTAATGVNTIDNLNFGQTWNWSTATTETALSLNANALTTGSGLVISSTGATTGTAGLASIINNTSTAGTLLNLSGTSLLSASGAGIRLSTNSAPGIISNTSGLDLTTPAGNTLDIDSGTTGAINIGTRSNAKTLTFGNATGATALNFNSGTGLQAFTSLAATTNAFNFTANSLTTANALNLSANGITTGSGLVLTSSYASGNSTNGLLYVANTGAITNGTIARIQSNSTAGSGLTVNANGKVGIGTTAPASALTISGNGFTDPNNAGLRFINTGTSPRSFMIASRSDGANGARLAFSDETAAAVRMTIGTNGFVGIGEEGPGARLHLKGDGNTDGNQVAIRFQSDGGSGRSWNVGTRGDGGTQRFFISDETGAAERFGIDSTGKTWVGQGAAPQIIPGYGNAGLNVISIGGSDGMSIRGPGSNNALNIYQPNTADFGITFAAFISDRGGVGSQQGRIEAVGPFGGTVNYNTTSDERLKTDTGRDSKGLEDLLKLKVRNYDWKFGGNAEGFFAQELYEVVPSAVSVGSDELDHNGNLKNPWAVDYGKLTPILAKSIQDLNFKVENGFSDYIMSTSTPTTPAETEVGQKITDILAEAPRVARDYFRTQMLLGKKAVKDFASERITALSGYFENIFAKKVHTEQICVKKTDGTEVCVNGDQLQNMVNGVPANQAHPSGVTGAMLGGSVGGGTDSTTPDASAESGDTTPTEPVVIPDNTEPTPATGQEPSPEPAPAADPAPAPTE